MIQCDSIVLNYSQNDPRVVKNWLKGSTSMRQFLDNNSRLVEIDLEVIHWKKEVRVFTTYSEQYMKNR